MCRKVAEFAAHARSRAEPCLHPADEYPSAESIGPLQPCHAGPGMPELAFTTLGGGQRSLRCITLAYAPDTPGVRRLLQRVAQDSGLDASGHFVPVPGLSNGTLLPSQWANRTLSGPDTCVAGECGSAPDATCIPCDWHLDNSTLTNFVLEHPNVTQLAVHFIAPYLLGREASGFVNSTQAYVVYRNETITRYPFFDDDHALELKAAMDWAGLRLALEEAGMPATELDLGISSRPFPKPKPRISGFDVVAQQGGNWFYVVPMITFYLVLTELVEEKAARLRLGMRMMGLSTSAFWCGWAWYATVFNLLTSCILSGAGHLAGFDFFTNTAWAVPIMLYFLFGLAMSALAALISTCVTRTRSAQTIGYSIILIGFVFQIIMDSGYAALVDILFADFVAAWVKVSLPAQHQRPALTCTLTCAPSSRRGFDGC